MSMLGALLGRRRVSKHPYLVTKNFRFPGWTRFANRDAQARCAMLHGRPMDAPPPSPQILALRGVVGFTALLSAVIAFAFAEGIERSDRYMLVLSGINAAMFVGMIWFFHQRYRWWGGDVPLCALVALQCVLAGLIVTNL